MYTTSFNPAHGSGFSCTPDCIPAPGTSPGAESLHEAPALEGGLPAEEVHRRALKARRRLAKAQRDLCYWLVEIEKRRLYRNFGARSVFHYAELYLELAPHTIAEYLRCGREMERLPLLAEACERGEISPSAMREISRVATGETEVEWLRIARSSTYRQIEKLVPLTPGEESPPFQDYRSWARLCRHPLHRLRRHPSRRPPCACHPGPLRRLPRHCLRERFPYCPAKHLLDLACRGMHPRSRRFIITRRPAQLFRRRNRTKIPGMWSSCRQPPPRDITKNLLPPSSTISSSYSGRLSIWPGNPRASETGANSSFTWRKCFSPVTILGWRQPHAPAGARKLPTVLHRVTAR